MAYGVYYRIGGATVTYQYDIVADCTATATTDDVDPEGPFPNSTASNVSNGAIDTPIGSCTFLLSARDLSGPSGKARRIQGSLTSYDDSDSDTIDTTGSAAISIPSGSFSMSCECDICLYLTNPQTGTGDLAPFWERIEDSPPNTALSIVLIPVPDSTTTGSLDLGALSLSVSGNVGATPSPITLYSPISLDLTSTATSSGGAGSAAADGAVSITLDTSSTVASSALAGLSESQTSSLSAASAQTGIESVTLSCSADASGDDDGVGVASGSRAFYGTRGANASGIIAYPYPAAAAVPIAEAVRVLLTGATVAYIDTSTGTFSPTISQDKADGAVSARATCTGNTQAAVTDSNSVDTYSAVAASLDEDSLTDRGDDPSARRLMFRGEAVTVATIAQAASVTVDDGTTLFPTGAYAGDWTASSGWTATITSGEVVAAGTGAGTLTRTFDADCGYFAGYRYLKFSIGSDVAGSVTLKLVTTYGDKTWTLALAGTGLETLYLDLMFPENAASDHDANGTRYPEDSDGYPVESAYFGVGRVSEIEFSGLAAGTNYQINTVTIARQSAAGAGYSAYNAADNVSTLQSLGYLPKIYPDNVVSEAGTTTEYFANRGILAQPDADGNALEEWSLLKAVTTGGETETVSTVYTHQNLTELEVRLTPRYPGVTLTETNSWTPSGDEHPPAKYELYNLDESYLAWCYGGGLLATSSGWEIGNGLTWANAGVVQPTFDSLITWPSLKAGNQDYFALSGEVDADRPFTLMFGTVLRGDAFGEVSTDRVPDAGEDVDLTQSAVDRGSGTSAAGTAWYETTDPATQPGSVTATARGDVVAFDAYTRLIHRIIWARIAKDYIAMATSLTGRTVRGYRSTGSLFLDWKRLGMWDTVATGQTIGAGIALAIDGNIDTHPLIAFYVDGSSVKTAESLDEGRTWGVSTTIGSGASPAVWAGATGLRYFAWVDGGAIKLRVRHVAGDAIATATIVASGVSSSGLGGCEVEATGEMVLSYVASGTVTSITSTDGGVTWA